MMVPPMSAEAAAAWDGALVRAFFESGGEAATASAGTEMTDAEFEPVELEGGDDTSPTREPIGRRLALASHFSPTVARRDSFGAELGLHLQEAQPPSAQPQPTQPTPTQQQSAPPSPQPPQQ